MCWTLDVCWLLGAGGRVMVLSGSLVSPKIDIFYREVSAIVDSYTLQGLVSPYGDVILINCVRILIKICWAERAAIAYR